MRKTIHKWFWVWSFDKEEKWLNEMAARGLALISVGWCRYDFEDCAPGEYQVRLEFRPTNEIENSKYISFLEETGAEHVGRYARWNYFRKKTADGEFALFSDNASKVKYLSRIIAFLFAISWLNVYFGCFNLLLFFTLDSAANLLGLLNFLLAAIIFFGMIRLMIKRKKLKTEQQVFE